MQCDACGEANPASHRFCQGCGARLPQPCPGCGAPTRAGARFCGACGTSLAPPRADTPRAAFRRVQVMEGEIKPVTVLVSDLVRSTELVADLGPEAAMGRLQPVLEQMCAAVERSGGTVIAGLGDGIVALFGAPRAQEGHALRACHAALAIRDAVCGLGQDLAVRTGLHSGDVVADMPTDGLERDLNAYGMTLHLASRLPAEAEPGGICLTEACRALLPDAYALAPMGPRRLRGVPAPVVLHALLGPRPGGAA
ncbi:adenylate/guanylate cyclase domain-containing protein, partial [Paracraurococcus ruber]